MPQQQNVQTPHYILPTLVIAQFCCTSLWFAGNAVMEDLVKNFHLSPTALGDLTAAVQFGFIAGTLLFALLSIADRYSPSIVFALCALGGAGCNVVLTQGWNTIWSMLFFRFLTGFFLAGIYPVGMKIAADYYEKGLGKSLSFLVGALVLGTVFPHLLNAFSTAFSWKMVLVCTSAMAILGGLSIFSFVPDGPYRKPSQKLDLKGFIKVFQHGPFRRAAFGYFGHMWELYAFWAFIPVILLTYMDLHEHTSINISLFSFLIIGVGSIACFIGGYIASILGIQKTASLALFASGLCCLFSPLLFFITSLPIFLSFLFFWGMAVIIDSPLFSTLVANHAIPEMKGTALTIVNCVGFSITIFSIQLLNTLFQWMNPVYIFIFLAFGPVLGLLALINKRGNSG